MTWSLGTSSRTSASWACCCSAEVSVDASISRPKTTPPASTERDKKAIRRSDSQGSAAATTRTTDQEILVFKVTPENAADAIHEDAVQPDLFPLEDARNREVPTASRPVDVTPPARASSQGKNRGFFRRSGSNCSNNTGNSGGSSGGRMNTLLAKLRRSGSGASVVSASTFSKQSNTSGADMMAKNNNLIWDQFFGLSDESKPSSRDERSWNEDAAVVVRDGERRLFMKAESLVFPASINAVRQGRPNMVRTTRFTLSTWLPKSLMAQFRRVANVYFLFITCLVCFLTAHPDHDSPKDWRSKVGPFVMVLFWTALKDLFEDKRRERDDNAVNYAKCTRFNHETSDFETIFWQDVVVGDILLIHKDEAFPADLVLLLSAGGGDAFISTVMLDGETTLKDRRAPLMFEVLTQKVRKELPQEWAVTKEKTGCDISDDVNRLLLAFVNHMKCPGLLFKFACPVACTADVRGSVQPIINPAGDQGAGICPFSEPNFLPRGCVLRNTQWVLALAMYAGDETKTRLNSMEPAAKFSNMQKNLNICIRGLLILLLAICSAAAILKEIGRGTFAVDSEEGLVVIFMMYWVKFYHVVPISLYLMYELMKLILIFQVNQDKQMVDPDTGEAALGRTADLVEEMGQIDFIFSDKTGTLTKNEMVFARCHVAGRDHGDFRQLVKGEEPPGVTNAKRILAPERGKHDPEADALHHFFLYLAVCHTVQVAPAKRNAPPSYAGMSPDEVALVIGAQQVGLALESRIRNTTATGKLYDLMVREPGGKECSVTVLHEIPFNSDRKRMSVIAKIKGELWCITKGADTVMESLLNAPLSSACTRDITEYSRYGLRMLIVAARKLDKKEYDRWTREVAEAKNLVDSTRDERVFEMQAKLETSLTFVGVTAVEDRLQDEVPETIQTLKDMGIRFWMLTGDKTETAVEIAKSCRLFDAETEVVYVTKARNANHAEDLLLHAHSVLVGNPNAGLVLDGQSAKYAMESAECRRIAVDVGLSSRACVCTRMSPMQKMQLVELVQDHDEQAITLGIGDGANDVPMIHKAHLGIAVRGKEGTQAVQASDVAISQFRFLVPLLACHGRRAYRRVAMFLCFYLYKNVALLMADVLWLFEDKFGPDIAYPEYLSIGYNVFYSTWHVLLVLGFDRDMSDETAKQSTELYQLGPNRELFNVTVFGKWVLTGIWHGLVMWVLPLRIVGQGEDMLALYDKEEPSTFWVASATSFTCINLIVNITLVLVSENPLHWITLLPTFGAWAFYFFAFFMLGNTGLGNSVQPSLEGVPQETFNPETRAPQATVVTVVVALSINIISKAMKYFLCPSETSVARRRARSRRSTTEAGP